MDAERGKLNQSPQSGGEANSILYTASRSGQSAATKGSWYQQDMWLVRTRGGLVDAERRKRNIYPYRDAILTLIYIQDWTDYSFLIPFYTQTHARTTISKSKSKAIPVRGRGGL
jgi:hypothetical protein